MERSALEGAGKASQHVTFRLRPERCFQEGETAYAKALRCRKELGVCKELKNDQVGRSLGS